LKDLRDTLVIARRELFERVKSKWFAVMTVIGPIGMVAMIVIPAVIARGSTEGTKVDIVDRTGKLAQPLKAKLEDAKWRVQIIEPSAPDPAAIEQIPAEEEKIRRSQINGYVLFREDALEGGPIVYRGDNASNQAVGSELRRGIDAVVRDERGKLIGLTEDQRTSLAKPVNFLPPQHTTGEKEASSGMGAFFIAYILGFILYMVITVYGIGVMRSVVQEKTSRVMELMVAAVKPRSLMAGKILGVGAAGLIQIGVWLAIGAVLLAYRDEVLGAFGIAGGGKALPPLAASEIVVILVYFVGGYFFYSAMYAALGAMVSSEQETQQVQLPVTMLLVIGLLCQQVVSNDPRGSSAAMMTTLPFWSPILMPMRYVLGGASLGEVALSFGVLALSTALVVRAAAKIYRVGVLLYGKRPGVKELIHWLRY
jgi:ABC-2 type transport system permease protein